MYASSASPPALETTAFMAVGLMAIVLAVLLVWLIIRARSSERARNLVRPDAWARARAFGWRWLRRMIGDFVDLAQRQDNRYDLPWVLLLGPPQSGKSSIAASIKAGVREDVTAAERQLVEPPASRAYFSGAILIDPEAPPTRSGIGEVRDTVRQLERQRPNRALDAIVLVVPAHALIGKLGESPVTESTEGNPASGDGGGEPMDVFGLAERFRRELTWIQDRIEFTFPVYVVVTQCDRIPGFQAFWARQPASATKEIVGWSSPYSLDSSFLPAWSGEAAETIDHALRQAQVRVAVAATAEQPDTDGFFLFPSRFSRLHAPLGRFLERVFKPDPLRANLFFRGVYFTGSTRDTGRQGTRDDIDFVDALFEQKIFAEQHLSRPTRQGMLSQDPASRRLQQLLIAGFAALFVWLAFSLWDLAGSVDATDNLLTEIKRTTQVPPSTSEQPGCPGHERIFAMLQQMASLDDGFSSFAIPISLGRDLRWERSSLAVSEGAFAKVIFPSIRCELLRQHKALTLIGGGAASAAHQSAAPPADRVERARRQLVEHVEDAQRFEVNQQRFNSLIVARSQGRDRNLVGRLEALLLYAFARPLPEKVRPDGYVSRALAQFDAEKLALGKDPKDEEYTEDSQKAEALTVNLARDYRDSVTRELDYGVKALGYTPGSKREEAALDVARVGQWAGWIESAWSGATPTDNPCARLRTTLAKTPGPAAEIAIEGSELTGCFAQAREILKPILEVTAQGALTPSQDFVKQAKGLLALKGQRFVQRVSRPRFACNPQDGWRATELERALQYVRDYQSFAVTQGLTLPVANATKRPLFDRLARRQLEAVLNALLRDAQTPLTLGGIAASGSGVSAIETTLAERSRAFSGVVDPLLMLLSLYQQLGFSSRGAIVKCVRDFANRQIASANDLAGVSRLYQPNVTLAAAPSAASGTPFPPGTSQPQPLYGLGGPFETKSYLQRERERVSVLAYYAAPFVTFLANVPRTSALATPGPILTPQAAVWEATIAQLQRFLVGKDPKSEVSELDEFFVKQLRGMTAEDCGKRLEAYGAPPVGDDLFSKARARLFQSASALCGQKTTERAGARYSEIAKQFNSALAGHFPFGNVKPGDASALQTRQFFQHYVEHRAELRKQLETIKTPTAADARGFLAQLDKAAEFFATNLLSESGEGPIIMQVRFRQPPSAGTGNIIRWTLESSNGDTAVRPLGAASISWQLPDALTLDLTWLETASVRPIESPSYPNVRVTNRTATFTSQGEWALYRFITRHRQSALAAEPNETVLRFSVPVRKSGGAAAPETAAAYNAPKPKAVEGKPGPQPELVNAQIAISLFGIDPRTKARVPLVFPASFPTRAPTLW